MKKSKATRKAMIGDVEINVPDTQFLVFDDPYTAGKKIMINPMEIASVNQASPQDDKPVTTIWLKSNDNPVYVSGEFTVGDV